MNTVVLLIRDRIIELKKRLSALCISRTERRFLEHTLKVNEYLFACLKSLK